MKSNQRRRRLRLIKSIEERSTKQFRSAASALTIAADTEFARLDADAIRQKLLMECRVNTSSVLRIEHPGAAPMDVAMDRPYLMIGSDPDCDIRLDHEEIKARHCFLQWVEGHLFCCDVEKKNGYFPQNDSKPSGGWISQDPVPIGPYRVSLVGINSAPAPNLNPLDRSPRLASEFPHLALRFQGVEQSENVWPVNRILTLIGRGVQCKLRLNHKSMANVHAALLRTQTGCWVIDLVKDGTTTLNSGAIQVSPVDVGDELQFGAFRVEVVAMGVPSVIPAAGSTTGAKKFGISSEKSLPPIRFDRQPKGSPVESARITKAIINNEPAQRAVTTVPVAEVMAEPVAPMASVQVPEPQIPVVQAPVAHTPVVQTPVLKEPASEVSAPQIQATSASMPQLLVPQAATLQAGEAAQVLQRPNAGPTTLSNELETLVNDLPKSDAPGFLESAPIRSGISPDLAYENNTTHTTHQGESIVKESTERGTTDAISSSKRIDIGSNSTLVLDFVKQQQRELTALKKQLNELKRIYEAAAGQLISKRMRDSLEKPVVETMQCHDSMQERLDQFMQQVGR